MHPTYCVSHTTTPECAAVLALSFQEAGRDYTPEFFKQWGASLCMWQPPVRDYIKLPQLAALFEYEPGRAYGLTLAWFAVNPACWRQGKALHFLIFVRNVFGPFGVRVIRSNKPAIALYEKAGFEYKDADKDSFWMESGR